MFVQHNFVTTAVFEYFPLKKKIMKFHLYVDNLTAINTFTTIYLHA